MTFRRFLATAVLVALGTCLPAKADQVSWLFLQNADAARFDGTSLRLEGVAPDTTAFSDRPYRAVQTISTAGFVAMWGAGSDSLAADPPNAGLSGLEGEGFRNVVVELSDPRMDGDALVYSAVVLQGTLPAAMTRVSLLVDAWPTSVNNQITDSVTQTNVKILGDAPAVAMGNLAQLTMDALTEAATTAAAVQQLAELSAEETPVTPDALLQPDPSGAPPATGPGS